MRCIRDILICIMILTFTLSLGNAEDNLALTVLAVDSLRDVHGPVNFPESFFLWIVALVLVIAGIILYFKFKPKNVNIAVRPVDTRTPWEIAYTELNRLKNTDLLEDGHFKEFYSRLSDIIRQYFERRFQIKAPEMTTEEFLWLLDGSRNLSADQRSTLKKFLNSCDIVKFAKYVPQISEAQESFNLAFLLIEVTKEIESVQNASESH